MNESIDVVVIGAGLAGLAAATEISKSGRDVLVLEASDRAGGRVKTDMVDGYRLDRGFQILLSAYPEAQRCLDYDTLDLQSFLPGALVRIDGEFRRLSDPLRRPGDVFSTIASPVGTVADKMRVLAFRSAVMKGTLAELWARPETSAQERLLQAGFSDRIMKRFFQPLFAGITLDPTLNGSSRVLEFVFRMLSTGDAVVPALGMGSIGDQLAANLSGTVRYGSPVAKLKGRDVTLADGSVISAGAVIIATDMTDAAEFTEVDVRGWNGVTSMWFAVDEPPVADPAIVLNGTGSGAINNLAVMSLVSASYAPPGAHSMVVSSPATGAGIPDAITTQLRDWFGPGLRDVAPPAHRCDRASTTRTTRRHAQALGPPWAMASFWLVTTAPTRRSTGRSRVGPMPQSQSRTGWRLPRPNVWLAGRCRSPA